jgi:hypothetical protein
MKILNKIKIPKVTYLVLKFYKMYPQRINLHSVSYCNHNTLIKLKFTLISVTKQKLLLVFNKAVGHFVSHKLINTITIKLSEHPPLLLCLNFKLNKPRMKSKFFKFLNEQLFL